MTGGTTMDGPDETPDVSDDDMYSGDQDPTKWVTHPINIRVSIPLLHRRFYFTLVAGQERRQGDRRREERDAHPLVTAGNVLFTFGIATFFTIIALGLLVVQSSIIE